MSTPRPRPRPRPAGALRRRVVAALAATATVAGLGVGLVVSAPVSAAPAPRAASPAPHTSAAAKASAPVKANCAPAAPGHARCFSLTRTDVAASKGVRTADTPAGYGPADLLDAYALPSGGGGGQVVAIVDAFDNPQAEADLAVYRAQYGLPPCTTANGCFRKVNQRGEQGSYPPPDTGWAGEISLDLDMVSAICSRCHLLLVEGDDNSTDNLGQSVDQAVAMGAKYVSNSYGIGVEDPSTVPLNAYYDHPGVAVTVSTGDVGTGPSWPSTTGTVTAVGGTSLTPASGSRGWAESAWADGGSGCSVQEAKPAWQTDPDCDLRASADVSAVADPATGVAVYDTVGHGGWTIAGGTSVSSPIIAGVYAVAGTPAAGTYPGSYPYAARTQLNDVTTGDNGSCAIDYICAAGPGYDGPTGLGTPKGLAAFRTGPHGVVKGKVTGGPTGKALSGAVVTAGDASATTDATGAYTMTLPVGTYTVSATAYGYHSTSVAAVSVAKGATVTESFTLAPYAVRNVGGVVTDGSGHGWPLYAKITFDGVPGGPVWTDPFTGRWDTTLPAGRTYSGHVEPVVPGYASTDVSFWVGPLDRTANVAVKVDPTSCAAPGYTTTYSHPLQTFDTTTKPAGWTVLDNNGSGGTWTFEDLEPRGNLTGGEGGFAIIDSDNLGAGNSQDTTLVSPRTDLTNDGAPTLQLDSYYKEFSNSTATIDLRVGTGAWKTIWTQTTETVGGPINLALPTAAHQKDVQVRFHYVGTFAYYWEVDNVLIGHTTCTPLPGGLVEGIVTDGNTRAGLAGAAVVSRSKPAERGLSATTPADGGLADGYYWLYSSVTGPHPFDAGATRYATSSATPTVHANTVTRQDFTLRAGRLQVTPSAVSGSVVLGGSTSKPLTLKNTGAVPLHVDLGEQDGGFVIRGASAKAAYAGVSGAAVQHVRGTYTTGRLAGTRTGKAVTLARSAAPAAAPWQSIADFPTPISNNAMAAGDGLVYSVGGFDGVDDVASGYAYDPTTLAWTAIADMSTTREAPSAAWVGGKLLVTGGWGPDGSPTGVTESYDPATDTWTTLAPNPTPLAAAGTSVLDGKVYLVGGCDASDCGSPAVMVYDPASDTWATGPDYPIDTAWSACAGLGAVYCAGGSAVTSTAQGWSLDPALGTWVPIADAPADVWGAGYSAANGQLVISGGVIDGSSTVTNEGWAFDPTTGAWTDLPASNNAYYRLGAACGFFKVGGSTSNVDPAHADAEVLPGYDSCGGGAADVTWLSETPASLDLAPGATRTVAVGFDSSTVTQPGTYTGKVTIGTDTPYSTAPVDVSMVVAPPVTWGRISGVVSGRSCAGATAPLAGATLQIDSWASSYTLSTAADGTYALWLDTRNNPLTLIAAKDGWAPQTTTARLTRGGGITQGFVLKPAKACP